MKKLLLVAVALMLVSSVSFAQGTEKMASPAKEVAKGIQAATEYVGKVVAVTVADPAKGVMDNTVKVTDEMGNPISFTVSSTAKVVDASLNVISLNQLKEGETVKVKATKTKEGNEKAEAINVM